MAASGKKRAKRRRKRIAEGLTQKEWRRAQREINEAPPPTTYQQEAGHIYRNSESSNVSPNF